MKVSFTFFLCLFGFLFLGGSSKNAIVGDLQSVEQRAYKAKPMSNQNF